MKTGKYILLLIIVLVLFSPNVVFCDDVMDRQDVRDYKKFFDELFPVEEDDSKKDTCTNVGTVYAECTGVNVTGFGTYDLETYVAGVIYAEYSGAIDIKNVEYGKAIAILVRSFTLNYTNNCKNSIISSDRAQFFHSPGSSGEVNTELYKTFADETAGIVMLDDKGKIKTGYYSLANAADCEPTSDGMCKFRRCSGYAEKSADNCQEQITEFIVPKGLITYNGWDIHYGGMEPYIAMYLSKEKKYTYDQLLKAFYGDNIMLAKLNPSGSSSNSDSSSKNTSTSSSFVCDDDKDGEYVSVDGVKFKFANYNIEGTGNGLGSSFDLTVGNVSQCPWYAKYRAIEIIETSTLSDDLKEKAKSVLLATSGNGNDWYGGKNPTLSYFQYSDDINKAKPGSIISWERNTHKMGHVGIVEKVNDDGSLVISEGWNMGGPYGDDVPSSIKIITHTMSLEDVRTYNGTGSFIGYTYLFSYKK